MNNKREPDENPSTLFLRLRLCVVRLLPAVTIRLYSDVTKSFRHLTIPFLCSMPAAAAPVGVKERARLDSSLIINSTEIHSFFACWAHHLSFEREEKKVSELLY